MDWFPSTFFCLGTSGGRHALPAQPKSGVPQPWSAGHRRGAKVRCQPEGEAEGNYVIIDENDNQLVQDGMRGPPPYVLPRIITATAVAEYVQRLVVVTCDIPPSRS